MERPLPWRTGRVREVRRECPAEIRKPSSVSRPPWVLQLQLQKSLQGQEGEVEGHKVQPEEGQMLRKLEKEQENKEKVQEDLLHRCELREHAAEGLQKQQVLRAPVVR